MASITSVEMADCNWLRSTFSGHYFPVMTGGPLRKNKRMILKQNSKTN
jgi:putative AlgH/UPF0301 family transcriptional regulator